MYQVLPSSLLKRSFGPLKSTNQSTSSYFDAPVGLVHLIALAVEREAAIIMNDNDVHRDASKLYKDTLEDTLGSYHGYLSEVQKGISIVSFANISDAINWAIFFQVGVFIS